MSDNRGGVEDSVGSRQAYLSDSNNRTGEFKNRTNTQFSGASGLLFEQAMAQTRMAVCLSDPDDVDQAIVFCNAAFERLTGYDAEEVIGQNCRFLQGPRTDLDQVQIIRDALAAEEVAVVELLNYRKDGSTFWNALHIGPIYDDEGKLRYYFGSQWDVTDVHVARMEEQHAKVMAREISHRLKNVFAVVGGIVNITGRARNIRDSADAINQRIQALGRAYETTLDDASMGTIEVGQAVRAVLRPYDPEMNRIVFQGDGVRTEPNAISTIGLTLHELATNATKYGALSNPDGTIEVDWDHETDRFGRQSLVLNWKERGGPSIASEPSGTGTGFDIADKLLGYANGMLEREWEVDGLKARITLPLAD